MVKYFFGSLSKQLMSTQKMLLIQKSSNQKTEKTNSLISLEAHCNAHSSVRPAT